MTLLKLYALYKQGSDGDAEGKRPGFTDMVGRAKFDAWAALKGTGAEDAMQQYVDLIEEYEQIGYNIYARAPASVIKSIQHQHTHLIKTAGHPRGFLFLMRNRLYRDLHGTSLSKITVFLAADILLNMMQ